MKTIIASLAVLCAATLTAQVSETIEVRIVNVDVTVSSRGAPVRGLTRDDFDIFEDGRPQTIKNFYTAEETRPVVTAAPGAIPAPVTPAQDPRFERKVLVLVDNYHTTRRSRDIALRELETMINDRFHGDYQWSIGVIGRGVKLLLPLSSNRNAIHEALEAIRNSATRQEGGTFAGAVDREATTLRPANVEPTTAQRFDADFSNRLEMAQTADEAERAAAASYTVPAIVDAARGFASTPGRKIVFLLTGDPGLNDVQLVKQGGRDGFDVRGVSTGRPDRSNEIWNTERTIEDFRKSIIHEANASDVSFYIWNVEGLVAPGDKGDAPMTNNSATFWLAKETGGRLVTGNDPARAVQEFDTASSSFYSLGYAPVHPDDGKYHTISVRLKRKGDYQLEYRTGYSSSPSAIQLERAMKSPTAAAMQATGLPVTLVMGNPATNRNEVTVPIEVKVPFHSLQFLPGKAGVAANLVVYVSVFNDIGENLVATSIPLAPGFKTGAPDPNGVFVYRNALKMTKGERNRVVVAVRDTVTDSIGMATEVVRF